MVEEAIPFGSRMYPPPESDSWPMCRPIVESMMRMLPSGGTVPERREWTETDERAFLGRAAVADPAIYRRKAAVDRGAAAIAWVICRANDAAGASPAALSVNELLASFGINGSVSQRAEPLLKANGVDPYHQYGSMKLGAADPLTAAKRRDTITRRDRLSQD